MEITWSPRRLCVRVQAPPGKFVPRGNICLKGLLPEDSVFLKSSERRLFPGCVDAGSRGCLPRRLSCPLSVIPRARWGLWSPGWVGQAWGGETTQQGGRQGWEVAGDAVLPSLGLLRVRRGRLPFHLPLWWRGVPPSRGRAQRSTFEKASAQGVSCCRLAVIWHLLYAWLLPVLVITLRLFLFF